MKLTIEIPDEHIDEVRRTHSVQDVPATDEQLARACFEMLISTTARVLESEDRAAASARKRALLEATGVKDVVGASASDAVQVDEAKVGV